MPLSLRNRWPHPLSVSLFAICTFTLVCGADDGVQDSESDKVKAEEVRSLVDKLGDPVFTERENATDQLIDLGLAAIEPLKYGLEHPDREIRYRCSRILSIVKERDFQRRLDAFANRQDEGESYDLAGWTQFKKALGDTATSRGLFVEIQKNESQTMEAFREGNRAVSDMLERRSQQILQETRVLRKQVELGSVATILFMAGREGVKSTPQANSSIYSLCYQQSFRNAMQGGTYRPLMRTLLGSWVGRGADWSAYQAMALSMQYDLKEGLKPAMKSLEAQGIQAHIRQYAVLTVGKLGDKSHIPVLEKLLKDETRISSRKINNVTYETQLRDVALAALLHITKQDHKKFGFDRLQVHSQVLFNTSTIGFKNNEARDKSLKMWNDFIAKQREKLKTEPVKEDTGDEAQM